jgi:hypothetical protein
MSWSRIFASALASSFEARARVAGARVAVPLAELFVAERAVPPRVRRPVSADRAATRSGARAFAVFLTARFPAVFFAPLFFAAVFFALVFLACVFFAVVFLVVERAGCRAPAFLVAEVFLACVFAGDRREERALDLRLGFLAALIGAGR